MKGSIVKTNWLKRGSLVALSSALCIAFVPAAAFGATSSDEIVCDISKGSVNIDSDGLDYTDASGTVHEDVDIDSSSNIVITGTTTQNTVKSIAYWASPLHLTFRNLNIDVSNVSDGAGGKTSTCAVYLGGDDTGKTVINLEGSNTLKSLDYAGLAIPAGETVVVDGTGSLDSSSVAGNSGTTAPGIGSPISSNSAPDPITTQLKDAALGTLIIDGGTINAHGDSAGIGVGQGDMGGTIAINGGTITATAGASSSAGIGCGQDAALGSITITGGDITATGSNAGSGIGGGGMHTNSGIVTILGGKITATGGNYGAGIGGDNCNGSMGDADQIYIGGGTILAYGGKGAAGIGGGAPEGRAENVTITGGNVTAYGGAAEVTEGNAYQFNRATRTRTVVGTQTTVYSGGAGIGDGGAYSRLTKYTSGDNAGQTQTSSQTRFGGKVTITGGTVKAYSGTVSADELASMTSAGFTNVDAESIGNGGYVKEGITEDNPYVEFTKNYTGGTISENGTQTYPAVTKSATTLTYNSATLSASALKTAANKANATTSSLKQIVLGSKVKTIKGSTFKSFKNLKTITVKTKKLTKSSVKNSLKGSKVTTIKVTGGKKYVTKYKTIFAKANSGKKVTVTK